MQDTAAAPVPARGPGRQRLVGTAGASRGTDTMVSRKVPILWSHMPGRAIVADTSNIPQNDIGSRFGIYTCIAFLLLLTSASLQLRAGKSEDETHLEIQLNSCFCVSPSWFISVPLERS